MPQEFGVFLQLGELKQFVVVTAESRHLAARAAEAEVPGWTAIAVTARWEIVGRCGRCEGIVFRDERSRDVRGRVWCFDC